MSILDLCNRENRPKYLHKDFQYGVLDDAAVYCKERRDESIPYAIMGYSMGSVLAYEMVARKLIAGELSHLFISAEVSPKERSLELRKIENPTDERILERACRLGGLDERMIQNKRFVDIYIRPMISDYRLFFGYCFGNYAAKISVNTTFFYCEQDTTIDDVQKWTDLINGKFDFHEMGENHFFINQFYGEMARIINKTLC